MTPSQNGGNTAEENQVESFSRKLSRFEEGFVEVFTGETCGLPYRTGILRFLIDPLFLLESLTLNSVSSAIFD